MFYDLFNSMEHTGALDMMNKVQLWALHFTFRPIIQRSLDRFRESYIRHPLTSESCRSPQQLFVRGILANPSSTGASDFLDRADNISQHEMYGVDYLGPIPEINRMTSEVVLEEPLCPVPPGVVRELFEAINPIDLCDNDIALNVYKDVLIFFDERGYNR